MGGCDHDRDDHFAADLGRPIKLHSHSYLGRNLYGRRNQRLPNLDDASLAGRSTDSPHHRGGSNANVSSAHRFDRRPHRNPFSCLWIACHPLLLPRLACLNFGDNCRLPGSFPPRNLLALLGVWRTQCQSVAINRACRLGHLRRHLPGDLVSAQYP